MKLPVDVYSPDQLSALILEIGNYRGHLRDAAVRAKTGSKKQAPLPEPSDILAQLLEESGVKPDDAEAVDTLRKELELKLKKSPVVHLLLAAHPTSAIKRQFTTWFRTEINSEILLTFAVRSDIGGGLILQAGSRVYDFSFKRRLIANKKRIAEIASSV